MKDIEELSHKIELRYLHLLLELLETRKIDMVTAKNSAQLMLTYLPFKNTEDIQHKLDNLKAIDPTLNTLHTYALKEIEIYDTQDVLEKMRDLMKNKELDAALEVSQNK